MDEKLNEIEKHYSSTEELPSEVKEDIKWLISKIKRLEADLKGTITKKNRFLKEKDKRIKELEWDNMVHRNGHGRLYAQHYSLKKKVEELGIDISVF